jgi:hypothetical protein
MVWYATKAIGTGRSYKNNLRSKKIVRDCVWQNRVRQVQLVQEQGRHAIICGKGHGGQSRGNRR